MPKLPELSDGLTEGSDDAIDFGDEGLGKEGDSHQEGGCWANRNFTESIMLARTGSAGGERDPGAALRACLALHSERVELFWQYIKTLQKSHKQIAGDLVGFQVIPH